MKRKLIIYIALTVLSYLYQQNAQSQIISDGDKGLFPKSIAWEENNPIFSSSEPTIFDENQQLKLTSQNSKLILEQKDIDGKTIHYRFQQKINGYMVEDAIYVIHEKDNKIYFQNGRWIKDIPESLPTSPQISESRGLEIAKNYIGAQLYKWEVPIEESFIKREQHDSSATFYPVGSLVYFSEGSEVNPQNLKLCYKYDIYAHKPVSRHTVFVDAVTGRVLDAREMLVTINTPGTAITAYSGAQSITTDYNGTTYRLREVGRGDGISTLDMRLAGTNYGDAVDFTDTDNYWNNTNAYLDQYATDAHWSAEKTYDYFFYKHNRNSYDNLGHEITSFVHYDLIAAGYPNNLNAFWDGAHIILGDGNGSITPLTSVEIIGHEFTHGITQRTSGLLYANEPGALNEGFSDIFGVAIKFYAKPNAADWYIGGSIGTIFRNLANPNQYNQPDTYGGMYWINTVNCVPGNNDNCGIHRNSGVLNYWFYLLATGGTGTNDIGNAYSVSGIGLDKAAKIAYQTNANYLTPTSKFADARTASIQAARQLYGYNSPEVIATTNAWYAVGVGNAFTPFVCLNVTNLNATQITATSARIIWNTPPEASSYKIDFKLATSTEWITLLNTFTDTSLMLNALQPATTYNLRITTTCNTLVSLPTLYEFRTVKPQLLICTPPQGLTHVIVGVNNVLLSWTGSPDAVSYFVEIRNSNSNNWTSIGPATTNTSIVTPNLMAGNTYYWRVTTNCSYYNSTSSKSSFIIPLQGFNSQLISLSQITNLNHILLGKTNTETSWIKLNAATAANSISATGLQLATIYNWSARPSYDLSISNRARVQFATLNNVLKDLSAYKKNTTMTPATTLNNPTINTFTSRVISSDKTKEIDLNTIKVYPNPAHEKLFVASQKFIGGTATLINMSGQVIIRQSIQSSNQVIYLNGIAKGVYQLQLQNKQENKIVKIVVE